MKKTPCSLGQYVLKDIEKTRGMEGYGFVADLWKGTKHIGSLEDYGDGGGVIARLKMEATREQKAALEQEVYNDMLMLLNICNVPEDSLARRCWGQSAVGAMEGFGELLLELTELVKMAKNTEKKSNGKPYVVMQTGVHWFEPMSNTVAPTGYIGFCLGDTTKKDYMGVTRATLGMQRGKKYHLVMLKYVENSIKWSLSFKDYAQMVETAKDYNKIHK